MIPVIVHTCDKYSWLWEGWYFYFKKNWNWADYPVVFFCNEDSDMPPHWDGLSHIKTGAGAWSDRLDIVLKELEAFEYVLYMQEDFWPKVPDAFPAVVGDLGGIDVMRVAPRCKFYRYDGPPNKNPRRVAECSPYIISHTPAVWNNDFLFESLIPGEAPQQHETYGTRRLIESGHEHRVYHMVKDWYVHACRKGEFTEEGKEYEKRRLATI